MNFRVFNQKVLEPGSMWLMILGIIFLCQPWVPLLPEWSVLILLIGIIAFNVALHVPPPEPLVHEDDTGPVSLTHVVKGDAGHG